MADEADDTRNKERLKKDDLNFDSSSTIISNQNSFKMDSLIQSETEDGKDYSKQRTAHSEDNSPIRPVLHFGPKRSDLKISSLQDEFVNRNLDLLTERFVKEEMSTGESTDTVLSDSELSLATEPSSSQVLGESLDLAATAASVISSTGFVHCADVSNSAKKVPASEDSCTAQQDVVNDSGPLLPGRPVNVVKCLQSTSQQPIKNMKTIQEPEPEFNLQITGHSTKMAETTSFDNECSPYSTDIKLNLKDLTQTEGNSLGDLQSIDLDLKGKGDDEQNSKSTGDIVDTVKQTTELSSMIEKQGQNKLESKKKVVKEVSPDRTSYNKGKGRSPSRLPMMEFNGEKVPANRDELEDVDSRSDSSATTDPLLEHKLMGKKDGDSDGSWESISTDEDKSDGETVTDSKKKRCGCSHADYPSSSHSAAGCKNRRTLYFGGMDRILKEALKQNALNKGGSKLQFWKEDVQRSVKIGSRREQQAQYKLSQLSREVGALLHPQEEGEAARGGWGALVCRHFPPRKQFYPYLLVLFLVLFQVTVQVFYLNKTWRPYWPHWL